MIIPKNFGVPLGINLNLLSKGNGSVEFWPYSVQIMDYSIGGTAGTAVALNKTINFRISLIDQSGYLDQITLGNLSMPSQWNLDLNPINFATYTGYGRSDSFNGTTMWGILYKINGNQMDDWYQFVLNTTNGNGATTVQLIYDSPWVTNAVPAMARSESLMSGGICANERGIALQTFWVLVLEGNLGVPSNPAVNVGFNINIAEYDVPTLVVTASALSNALPQSHTATSGMGITCCHWWWSRNCSWSDNWDSII